MKPTSALSSTTAMITAASIAWPRIEAASAAASRK